MKYNQLNFNQQLDILENEIVYGEFLEVMGTEIKERKCIVYFL
jgi:hypothetical protein